MQACSGRRHAICVPLVVLRLILWLREIVVEIPFHDLLAHTRHVLPFSSLLDAAVQTGCELDICGV